MEWQQFLIVSKGDKKKEKGTELMQVMCTRFDTDDVIWGCGDHCTLLNFKLGSLGCPWASLECDLGLSGFPLFSMEASLETEIIPPHTPFSYNEFTVTMAMNDSPDLFLNENWPDHVSPQQALSIMLSQ